MTKSEINVMLVHRFGDMIPIRMLNYFPFILCCWLTTGALAQDSVQDTLYLNMKGERVGSNEAEEVFYGVLPVRSGKDTILMTYYRPNGAVFIEQYELNGKREGISKRYHENGSLQRKGVFKKDLPIGEFHFYDYFGDHQRTEVYGRKNKLIAVYYYNDNGIKVFAESKRESSFGRYRNEYRAMKKMGEFVVENIERPAWANDLEVEVRIYANFLIDPDGKLIQIEAEPSEYPALEVALVKMIKKMPRWTPAKHKGKPVYSQYSIGYTF